MVAWKPGSGLIVSGACAAPNGQSSALSGCDYTDCAVGMFAPSNCSHVSYPISWDVGVGVVVYVAACPTFPNCFRGPPLAVFYNEGNPITMTTNDRECASLLLLENILFSTRHFATSVTRNLSETAVRYMFPPRSTALSSRAAQQQDPAASF